ncbi:MAG TPA: hypothetical protein VI389_01730 [Geobacteraceae bacterium]
MKPYSMKKLSEKFASVMIVAIVVLGTAAFSVTSQAAEGGALLSKLFLAFLGAIITIQVIPGLILLGAMFKGLAGLGRKQEVEAETEDQGKQ